jgi:peptide/nickel transport system permease protein
LISARLTIPISLSAVGLSAVVGGLLGTVATFRGGWLESIVMRVADVQMAFPAILLSLGIVAILGASLGNLIFVLALSGWVLYARVSRSQVLTLKRLDFVEAARASGASEWYILRRHIASNVLPTLLVMTTYLLGGVVTGESALSFLGLGVQPPSFTWGGMLSEGTAYMMVAWWLATFPGIAIMLTVFSATAIGEWLRDYFDPRLRME